jgi:hypothetical protein
VPSKKLVFTIVVVSLLTTVAFERVKGGNVPSLPGAR